MVREAGSKQKAAGFSFNKLAIAQKRRPTKQNIGLNFYINQDKLDKQQLRVCFFRM